jgi:quercetin dioxygenase-like cupin family protein
MLNAGLRKSNRKEKVKKMSFSSFKNLTAKQLAEGVSIKAVSGERLTLTLFDLSEGSILPEHSHPHEQIGTVLKGSLELTIGNETKIVAEGDLWVIPPDVSHAGKCLKGPAEVLEVFSPVREDYA